MRRRPTPRISPASPQRRSVRGWIAAIYRRCFAADPRQQLWSWFLPNPVSEPQPSEDSNRPIHSQAPRVATILLVEPDPETRDRIRLWLQLDGHLVAEAANGAEALKIIGQEPPDVVLLDLSRSATPWMEFFVGLNRMRPRPNVRTIALAPCTTGADGCEGIRFFASDVLQQPVRQEDLRCAVGAALNDIADLSPDAEPRGSP